MIEEDSMNRGGTDGAEGRGRNHVETVLLSKILKNRSGVMTFYISLIIHGFTTHLIETLHWSKNPQNFMSNN